MTTPLIGLACRHDTSHVYAGEPIHVQSDAYLNALISSGATPFLIPLNLPETQLRQLYAMTDGILLTGGGDIDPSLYHDPNTKLNDQIRRTLSDVQPDRDQTELTLTQWAFEDQKPLFGICRGLQILALWSGGSLCPDIPTLLPEAKQHQYGYLDDDLSAFARIIHQVHLTPHSRMAQICQSPTLQVNSLHHQAALSVNEPLHVVGCSDDDIIEAIEAPDHPFFCAVQWHPEYLIQQGEMAQRLFDTFVQASRTK